MTDPKPLPPEESAPIQHWAVEYKHNPGSDNAKHDNDWHVYGYYPTEDAAKLTRVAGIPFRESRIRPVMLYVSKEGYVRPENQCGD